MAERIYSAVEVAGLFNTKCDEAMQFIIDFTEGKRYENDIFAEVEYSTLSGKNKGIYVFVVNEDLTLTTSQIEKFNRARKIKKGKNKGKFASIPDLQTRRLKKGDFFYVGSVISGSIKGRIRQHYNASLSKTSALRLNIPDRKFIKPFLTVYAFVMKREFATMQEIGECIVKAVERKIHNHKDKKPLSGSGRSN